MATITETENKHIVGEEKETHISHKKKFELTTPAAIVIGSIIIAISHIAYGALVGPSNTQPATLFAGAPISEKDFPTGDLKSEVVVVEYSDTECPFCARLHPTMTQIQAEYKDRATFVYRYFPLTQIHPNAFAEAQAIECVGKQLGADKRREYIDQMFQYKITNNSMTLPKNGKEDLAKNFRVNMVTFNSCVAGDESSLAVNAGIQDGVAAGVTGTPATIILKRDGDDYEVFALIEGAREYEYFKAALDAALE